MSESPSWAQLGIMNLLSQTTAMAAPPIIGQGLYTVCPPPTCEPACLAASVKPCIMRVVVTSCSYGFISVETPKIMRTYLMSVMPMAQRSEAVLQQAIRPNIQGDQTNGQKKSRVETRVQGGTFMVETSGVSMPTGLGSFARQERSLFWGTLHPHPFIFVQLVITKSAERPCYTGSKGFILGGLPSEPPLDEKSAWDRKRRLCLCKRLRIIIIIKLETYLEAADQRNQKAKHLQKCQKIDVLKNQHILFCQADIHCKNKLKRICPSQH